MSHAIHQSDSALQDNAYSLAVLAGIMNSDCPEGIPLEQVNDLAKILQQIACELLCSAQMVETSTIAERREIEALSNV